MVNYSTFCREVQKAQLTPCDCGYGHWQIRGGVVLVNFYPETRQGSVACVNGTTRGIPADLEAAIRMAKKFPESGPKPKRIRHKSKRRLKLRLLERDPHCAKCGKPLTDETATIDHRIPRSRGGSNGSDNLRLLCEPCNRERGNDVSDLTDGMPIDGNRQNATNIERVETHLL